MVLDIFIFFIYQFLLTNFDFLEDKKSILKRAALSVITNVFLGNFNLLGIITRFLVGWVVAVTISYKINKYARVIFLKINSSEKSLS